MKGIERKMNKVTIVKIFDSEKYKPYGKIYGILQDKLEKTAIINWNSNVGGICTNVDHKDYSILPDYLWDIIDGEVVLPCCGGYIRTGLKIWK